MTWKADHNGWIYTCSPQVPSSIHPSSTKPSILQVIHPRPVLQVPAFLGSSFFPESTAASPLVNLSSYKLERASMILHFSENPSDAFLFQASRNIITNPIHSLTDGLVELPILETLLLIQHHRRQCCRCTNHLLCPTYGRYLTKHLYVYGYCC